MRTFEFSEGTSNKFWNIELSGNSFTVTFGKIGTVGQTQTKTFADTAKAQKEYDKLVSEKTKKGYHETTPATTAAPTSLRESLEQALADDPEDIASHMAYADHLTDQGDPLGDFIRVQLALEDTSLKPPARKKLQTQEKKLLDANIRTWLGELAPYLLGEMADESESSWLRFPSQYTFRRGWLESLTASRFTVAFTRALARSPAVRLLRQLSLHDQALEDSGEYAHGNDIPEDTYWPQFYPMIRSANLGNVTTFIVGEIETEESEAQAFDGGFNSHTQGEAVANVVRTMPKLERLFLYAGDLDTDLLFTLPLPRLRELRVYHNTKYPLTKLAKNTSLENLTHLVLHPHALDDENAYIREPAIKALVTSPVLKSLTHLHIRLTDAGDKGIKTIIASGLLKRLKVLDLRHGCVTDAGARALAGCPDVKNLVSLDLTNNALTQSGIEALQRSGVPLIAEHQWPPGGPGNFGGSEHDYLMAGDFE